MKKIFFLFGLIILSFYACEDIVEIDLEDAPPVLVVDAWLTNQPSTQVIKLRNTAPYFTENFADIVTGATVKIVDNDGLSYDFTDEDNDGNYTWGGSGQTFGTVGKTYNLSIDFNGKTYTSTTVMKRTTAVDSIVYEPYENAVGEVQEGYFAEFYGRDLEGEGDNYWIKTYKNGQYLNKPSEINTAYDAAFDLGIDGLVFITPIRRGINRTPDDGDGAEDTGDIAPYAMGDTITVEIHGITNDAFNYLNSIQTQMTLGDASIFAEPPSNVPTNISSSDTAENPQGFFNVSDVSSLTIIVE